MNRIVLAALLCPLLGVMAHAQTTPAGAPPTQNEILFGAYTPVPSNTPVVVEARNYVQSRLMSMTLGEVSVAYTQVVAGLNVKIVCSVMEDGHESSWKFVTFKSLDGQWHLGLAQRL